MEKEREYSTPKDADITYEILHSRNPLHVDGLITVLRTINGKREDTYLHWHYGVELLYVLDGCVDYMVEGISKTVGAGQFVLVNSGFIHQAQNGNVDKSNTTLTIVLPDKWIYELTSIADSYFVVDSENAYKAIADVLGQITEVLAGEDKYKHLLLRKELINLIYVLFSEAYVPFTRPHITTDKIKEVLDYLNEHYSENCTLEFVAGKFGIQKNYLCRIFRLSTGTTYHKYLSRIRLDVALNLLAEGRFTSAECALKAGFSSEKVFIDWCHRIYSCSPVKQSKKLSSH